MIRIEVANNRRKNNALAYIYDLTYAVEIALPCGLW